MKDRKDTPGQIVQKARVADRLLAEGTGAGQGGRAGGDHLPPLFGSLGVKSQVRSGLPR